MSNERDGNQFESWSDEEMARAARLGSRPARDALYLRHRALIERLGGPARRLLRAVSWGDRATPIEQEDISQQAFVIFCNLLASWDPARSPFMRYLPSAMKWALLDYVRGQFRHASSRNAQDVELVEAQPDHAATDAHSQPALRKHVQALPVSLRETVSMRFYQGFTTGEIARAHGRTRRSVNRRLQTAVSSLRQSLQDEWEDCF